MRKIAANYIFPVSGPPVKNGYLILSDEGEILEVCGGSETLREISGLEYYSGILIPGFVNVHCHLELSHLKGKLEAGKGLAAFLENVPKLREAPESEVHGAIQQALRYMWSRGINGLGDVVNTQHTLNFKVSSPIKSHSFIELFSAANLSNLSILEMGNLLHDAFKKKELAASLVPHSFYGTPAALIILILENLRVPQTLMIHFKEHPKESSYASTEKLRLLLQHPMVNQLLLVHNIYMTPEEMQNLQILPDEEKQKIFLALCPNSNRYIENKLPPVDLLMNMDFTLCLGTDSLASNRQLSIFDEIKTLLEHVPGLSFNELLSWATLNGAKALGFEKELGSFDPGKKPGVLLIEAFNFKKQTLTKESTVTRLV
ncbi:MAG: amidohydrolase family protein [Salinivirgaceae bacterium]